MKNLLCAMLFGIAICGCANQMKTKEKCESCDASAVMKPAAKEKAKAAEEEDEVVVKSSEVPPKVMAAFEAKVPGAQIKKIEKENKTGVDCYDFKYTKDGKAGEAKFNASGEAVAPD